MKRLLLPLVALALIASPEADLRAQFIQQRPLTPNGRPTIAILRPSAAISVDTPNACITLGGLATDDRGKPTRVDWANATTGGSGQVDGSTRVWETSCIALNGGANVITLTVTDSDGLTQTDTITVTRAAPDVTPPTLTIVVPPGPVTVTDPSYEITGTCADNDACVEPTFTCSGSCSPSSGTATGAAAWTIPVTLAGGANTVEVTPHDVNGNVGTAVSRVVTLTTTDATPPSCDIVLPDSGATYTSSSSTVLLTGSSSDGVGTGVQSVTWVTDRGQSGTASGTTSWSQAALPLAEGVNNVTVTCRDVADNTATDTIAITYVADLIITTTSMDAATHGVAYSFQLAWSGGTGAKTVTNNGAGSTLNDADPQCPEGSSVSTSGLVTFTSSGSGTVICTWTAKIVDSASPTPDEATRTIDLVIRDAGSGPDAYYTAMCGRTDVFQCVDLRDQPTIDAYSQRSPNVDVTYCTPQPTCDSDDHRQDAAKVVIPPFFTPTQSTTINSTMAASAEDWSNCTRPVVAGYSCFKITTSAGNSLFTKAGRWWRIGSEIMTAVDPDGAGPQRSFDTVLREAVVLRGTNGTTIASHASGTVLYLWTNSLPNQVRIDIESAGGTIPQTREDHTYFFSWDDYRTSSYQGNLIGTQKTFQLTCWNGPNTAAICIEPQISYATNTGVIEDPCGLSSGATSATDVGSVRLRVYHGTWNGNADWSLTNGETLGPGTSDNQPVCPQTTAFVIKPNVRTRWYARVEQRANDYDYVTLWLADANTDAVKVLTDLPMSVGLVGNPTAKQGIKTYYIEDNTSEDTTPSSRVDLHNLVHYSWWLIVLEQAGRITDGTLTDAGLAASGALARPQ